MTLGHGTSLVVLGLLIIAPIFLKNFFVFQMTMLLIYALAVLALNILTGGSGQFSLGQSAFYAVGAYSYALLAQFFGLSFWICLPLAGILAAFWGVLLGFPVLRLRGDYLAIVTLGFGEIVRLAAVNTSWLGNRSGVSNIPKPPGEKARCRTAPRRESRRP